jgi:hypothetical protein
MGWQGLNLQHVPQQWQWQEQQQAAYVAVRTF